MEQRSWAPAGIRESEEKVATRGAASRYAAVALLRDGGSITLRALRADDRARLTEHFDRMSPESVYFRFFRVARRLSDKELRAFTEMDFIRNAGLVATIGRGEEERIVGVGRYSVVDESLIPPRRAEVAFSVTDDHQGRGIGTLLLEHLAEIARANGVEEFEADVLGENNRMLKAFASSGFTVMRSVRGGIFHLSFATKETAQLVEAHDRRERLAATESMRPILNPGSVAVVGASRREGSLGAAVLANIVRCGFQGHVFPVNPNASRIQGLQAFPSVTDIGEPVDLAIIAVPAAEVEEVVADCARARCRAVVVISAGFAELGAVGRDAERRLRDLARSSGMRMVGPNCMGILNADPGVSLNGTFAPAWPPSGNVGVLSQSGALGLAILDYVQKLNVGISTFVSVGNKADVSGNDLLAYWSQDPNTSVIVLYLESFGNPRKFARVAPEIARRKPIVAVKSGRSAAGMRAASSHSAALASLDVAVDALFEQAGVIRTATLGDLFDVALLLSTQPVPGGPRVGVVTNAGGPGILLADACETRGLTLPVLAPETISALRSVLPREAGVSNPVDMIASATPDQFASAIEAVGHDPNVDSVIVIHVPPAVTKPEELSAAIAHAAGLVPPEKPVLTVFLSTQSAPSLLCSGPRGALPAYPLPESAALALAAANRYGRWRERPPGRTLDLRPFERSAIRAVIDRVLISAGGPTWLEAEDLATVLRAVGIDFAMTVVVPPERAAEAAERMGYPLVAKAIAPGLVHKSDVGGVVLDLRTAADVREGVSALSRATAAHGIALERVLLQREVPGKIEAIVGVTTDPTFGPIVVCGLGGVFVELLRDVSYHLTPVSDVDAAEMIAKLRTGKLLDGYRGLPPGDREALSAVIQRVSALVEAVPEILELDLNPVKVLAPGQGAVVVDGRMRIGPL